MDRRTTTKTPPFWFSRRFSVAAITFLVNVHIIAMIVNLSIAIVAMTSTRTVISDNQIIVEKAEFDWDSKTKSFLLGVFSYGFLVLIFCSSIVMKIGGSTTIGITMMFNSIITIVSPLIIRYDIYLYIAARIIQGVFEGLTYVGLPELWAQWAPLQDRSKLMAISQCGCYIGFLITYPICGYAIHNYDWPAAFYVTGGSSLLSSILWLIFVPNTPESDKLISLKELTYIVSNRDENERPKHIVSTFKHIFISKCSWALGICKFTHAIAMTVVNICLPMYIKDIVDIEIHQVGILSALPSCLPIITTPLAGYLTDYIQTKRNFTTTRLHKLILSGGYIISIILLASISQLNLNFTITILFFAIFSAAANINFVVIQVTCVSLAPQCASLLASFLELFYSVGYFVGPMTIGLIVSNHKPQEWNLCFLLASMVSLITCVIFSLYGSAVPQPWSYSKSSNHDDHLSLDDNISKRDRIDIRYKDTTEQL